MRTSAIDQSKRQKSYEFRKKLYKLTIAGGVAFWVATIATSLLPIAAAYRSAFSNWSIQAVWIGSWLAGIMTACGVSYFLLRLFPKIPAEGPVLKSVLLSAIALVIAITLNDVPMVLHAPGDALDYFLIGVVFNAARFLILGIAVGYRYRRL